MKTKLTYKNPSTETLVKPEAGQFWRENCSDSIFLTTRLCCGGGFILADLTDGVAWSDATDTLEEQFEGHDFTFIRELQIAVVL